MATTTEQLRAAQVKIDDARNRVQADPGASPVLVAVVNEFAKKAAKATATADERTAVIHLHREGQAVARW